MTTRCVTLWIGPEVGSLERACLASMIRQGHDVILYCYAPPRGVPAGVVLADAAEILPQSSVTRHRRGSVALFSDRFRFELQRRGLGTWLDCDMYLLGPLDGDEPCLLGESAPGEVESAVLRLPADSPLLDTLLEPFAERTVPCWLPWRPRIAAQLRRLTTGRSGIGDMPWGTLGPHALSWAVREAGSGSPFARAVRPSDVFYPVHWRDAAWALDPKQRLQDRIKAETVAIHLWNECLRPLRNGPAPAGSFLAQLEAEGAAIATVS